MPPDDKQFNDDGFFSTLRRDGVARDWVDLRDRLYSPSLKTLAAEHQPPGRLFRESALVTGNRLLQFDIRHQGSTGRCVGHALAALIDLQRRLQITDADSIPDHERASADMLYHMARFHDQFTLVESHNGRSERDDGSGPEAGAVLLEAQDDGVRSLRSAVKGLYHHGVFLESPDRPDLAWPARRTLPTVLQAKAARATSLGAYYRLRPVLNHYHAALNDTGTILVSACVHRGWAPYAVRDNHGVIVWQGEVGEATQHAFVIVGYTAEGFLILNSWGSDWGGYRGCDGIALWTYQDWARNVVDGWVLRLGVSAPGAFDLSIGEQGLANAYGSIRSGSTPCLELMGHYIHIDDGFYTELSTYPCTPEMIAETMRILPASLRRGCAGCELPADLPDSQSITPRRGMLLWIAGSLEGMKDSFETAVRRKRLVRDLELYPFFVFWCNDFVEDAIEFLRSRFEDTAEISGQTAEHRDQLIENSVRGTGRAFWREVESCARRGIWGPMDPDLATTMRDDGLGHLGKFLTDLYQEVAALDCQIHVVADGAGVLVFDEMIRLFKTFDAQQQSLLTDRIGSVNLALPAIDVNLASERILPLINYLNETAAGGMPRARIHVPSGDIEQRICLGEYRKSILHLIANAFEDREASGGGEKTTAMQAAARNREATSLRAGGRPKTMLGMANAPDYCRDQGLLHPRGLDPFHVVESLEGRVEPGGQIDQGRLTHDTGLENDILQSIRYYSSVPQRK